MDNLEKGAALPVSIGKCADLLHDVKTLRLAMQKEVDAVKSRETEIQEHIINTLSEGDTGAAGLRYRVQVIKKRLPRIAEWGVFCSWVRKNDRFDMLQKRIGEKAVADWLEDEQSGGRVPPGLEMVNIPEISLTKL